MSGLSNFYNNLLTIQVAVFGIITAAVFVLVQISYSVSHRHSLRLFRDRVLIVYFAVSIVALTLTSSASLLLSLPKHDFLPGYNVNVRGLLLNLWTPPTLLFLTGLSAILFCAFLLRNIQYLHPQRVLLLISKTVTPEEVQLFLLKKYGLSPPRLSSHLGNISDENLQQLMRYVGGTGPEPSEENMQQFAEAERENEQRFKEDQLRYIEFKRKAESATDPLDTLSTVAVAALKATDLQTLAEVPKTIRGITRAALASIKPSGLTHWNPAGGLADKWVMHLINFTSRLLEVARKEGLSSVEVDILQTTDDCVCQLIEKEEEQAIIKIMGFWKQVSNAAIGNNKSVFIWLITKYAAIGETALERELKSISDETFRHLGWLGENLLDKTGYTEKAIMYDLDYSTEFDELLNALLSFGSIYSSKYSKQYPLIYFDAIRVVFIKLSKLTKGLPSDSEIKNSLYACISSIASFIDAALRSSNSDGAALAVIRIRQCYEELVTIQLHERAAEVVSLLVDAAVSAVQSDCKSHLIPEGIGEYLTKLLIKCPYKDKIASAVRDSLIKSHGTGHSKVWGFVTELGKRMGTNFGLMFDEKTGKIYANDDPRRQ